MSADALVSDLSNKTSAQDAAGASQYSLHTVNTPLLARERDAQDEPTPSYGTLPTTMADLEPRLVNWRTIWKHKPLLYAALKCAAIFLISCAVLGGTIYVALPPMDPEDRERLHIPKSFAQLKELDILLKKYVAINPFRVVVCYVVTYLFLQAFSLPGSMYLSILGGAVWGMPRALPLACTCVATGATLCYLLSAAFGPALLTLPGWRERLDRWSDQVEAQRSNLWSYLIIIRIAPFPPHWVVNVLCPHLRIGIIPFWITTWFGIVGVTIIHTAIGGGLERMTSAEDFHLISWQNFFLLAAIVFAASFPVGLRHVLQRRIELPEDSPECPDPVQQIHHDIDSDDALSIASDELNTEVPAPQYSEQGGPKQVVAIETPTGQLIKIVPQDDSTPRRETDADDDRILATGGPEQSK